VPDVLYDIETIIKYDKYFLMDIDVEWIADGLRDLGDSREQMMKVFRNELIQRAWTLLQLAEITAAEEIVANEIAECFHDFNGLSISSFD
jgi:nicotinamide riboside kinase